MRVDRSTAVGTTDRVGKTQTLETMKGGMTTGLGGTKQIMEGMTTDGVHENEPPRQTPTRKLHGGGDDHEGSHLTKTMMMQMLGGGIGKARVDGRSVTDRLQIGHVVESRIDGIRSGLSIRFVKLASFNEHGSSLDHKITSLFSPALIHNCLCSLV